MLWLYLNYIKEDWNEYTPMGRVFYFIPWVIRSFFVWLFAIFFIPEYLFKQSNVYKQYIELGKVLTPQEQMKIIKEQKINQTIDRNNFLTNNLKKGKYNRKF